MQEADGLVIRALGGLTLEERGRRVSGLRSRTAGALLVFLAGTGRAIPREVLAELFWPERPRPQALSNLRTALSILRSAVGPYLAVTRQNVAMNEESNYWLDAADLKSRLVKVLAEWDRTAPLSPDRCAEVEEGLCLYDGEFLQGFYLDSPGFEEWALMEREYVRLLVMEALDALVDALAAREAFPEAIPWANRLVQLDPLREQAHRKLMVLLARSGQRADALARFERCRHLLGEELGARPSAETAALYDRIRNGALDAGAKHPRGRPVGRVPHNLPTPGTTFVGREVEARDLRRRLDEPECRLLTVLGPGGIGKTRLAIAVARQCLDRFPDGVFWVDLSSDPGVAALINDLAAAIGLSFTDGIASATDQLVAQLGDRTVLLVLDSFEHLPEAASLVGDILARAPRVKVMATSREVTGLDWEWLVPVQGLSFPTDDTTADGGSFEAVQLFVERARRTQPAFALAENRVCVNRLCRLVEGMPLGIELAAAWTRTMACADIVSEIMRLESPFGARPQRHRSLRALYEHAWQHLAKPEQDALAAFSVFRGGFRRDAAEAVAGVSPSTLAALINKSQLRLDPLSGRYHIHELLRTHAAERLAERPDARVATRARHAAFYADFLNERENALVPGGDPGVLREIDAEMDNARAAFAWAAEAPAPEAIGRALGALSQFYRIRGWHPEAISVFERALSAVEQLPESPGVTELQLGLLMALTLPLLTSQGYMSPRLGEVLARAWEICERSEDSAVPALVLQYLATHRAGRGEYAQSLQIAKRLREVGERAGDAGLVHAAHYGIGFALFMQGAFESALGHLEKVIDWYDPARHHVLDLVYGMSLGVFSLCWASMAQWMMGHPDRALASGREAIAMARALDHPLSLTLALLCGGSFLHDFRREPAMGLECAEEALRIATEHALGYHAIAATMHHVLHLVALGRHEEALGLVHSNADAARSATPMFLPRILLAFAMTVRAEHRHQEAIELLNEALSVGEQTGERLTLAEVIEARGEVLREVGDDAGAERDFQRALEIARGQEARSWELRAATGLARLWHAQGRTAEARALLEPVYRWFTEGFDTGDLREAKALLEGLSPAS